MAYISASADPTATHDKLKQLMEGLEQEPKENLPPRLVEPPETRFTLCGGISMNQSWVKDFEVRELTGKDEEILTSTSSDVEFFKKVLELSLVSVGGARANAETPKHLMSGDLDTVLLASRIITFGPLWKGTYQCPTHGTFTAEIDLREIPRDECSEAESIFEVTGTHGSVYRVSQVSGATHYKILDAISANIPSGEISSLLLSESILDIDGEPLTFPKDQVRRLGWADRRMIMREIDSRKVGPNTEGVKVACPDCGTEQDANVSIAATFLS